MAGILENVDEIISKEQVKSSKKWLDAEAIDNLKNAETEENSSFVDVENTEIRKTRKIIFLRLRLVGDVFVLTAF